jgi:hypothetical protein
VGRGHDDVEGSQEPVGDGDVTVIADVGLHAREHVDVDRVVDLADLGQLLAELVVGDADAADHPRAGGVVADGDVLVAEVGGSRGHLPDRDLAVGPRGVDVEVAADRARLEQVREVVLEGGLDLAAVRAEFGRNPGHADGRVHALLGLAGDALADPLARVGVVDVTDVEDAVLVHLQVALDGDVPDGDVVLLAAGEVLEGAAERRGGDDAEVDPDVARADAGLVLAGLDQDVGLGPLGEGLDDGFGLVAGCQGVHVADGGLPAADRARGLDALDALDVLEVRDDRVGQRSGLAQQLALVGRPGEVDVVEDVLLGLRAEALDLADLPRRRRRLEVVEGLDAEGLGERLDGLRADALDARQLVEVRGDLGAELLELLDLAGLDVLDDLRGDGLADVVDLGDGVLAGEGEALDGLGVLADAPGGVAVGPGLVVDVLGLEAVRELLEQRRDLLVARHASAPVIGPALGPRPGRTRPRRGRGPAGGTGSSASGRRSPGVRPRPRGRRGRAVRAR